MEVGDELDTDKKKILSFFCTKPCSSPACFLIVTTAGEPQANRIRDHCLVKLSAQEFKESEYMCLKNRQMVAFLLDIRDLCNKKQVSDGSCIKLDHFKLDAQL